MRQFLFSLISSWIRIKYSYRCYALEAIRYKYVDNVYMLNSVHKAYIHTYAAIISVSLVVCICNYDSLYIFMSFIDEAKSKAGFGNGRQINMKRLHS